MLFRLEILIFFISIGYIFYYFFDILFTSYKSKKQQKQQRIQKRQEIFEQQQVIEKNTLEKPIAPEVVKKMGKQEIEALRETIKRVQVNKARGYYDTARSLIIEGLAIDKYNRELNTELWEVYELEEQYKKAEYIYRDMLKIYTGSVNLLKRLGNVLALQWNLSAAVKSYEQAFEKKRDDIEIVDTLSGLFFELKNYTKSLKYSKLFLKDKPRDVEKLGIKWYCLEKEWKIGQAIECYRKILEIQPYNIEIKERIQKLETPHEWS